MSAEGILLASVSNEAVFTFTYSSFVHHNEHCITQRLNNKNLLLNVIITTAEVPFDSDQSLWSEQHPFHMMNG